MIFGCCPVRSSKDVHGWPGAPVVRFRISTACSAAKFQKEMGAPLAMRLERTCSMMLRMVRSATPFSECTCGGHVVCSMVSASRNSCLEQARCELAGVVSFERSNDAHRL